MEAELASNDGIPEVAAFKMSPVPFPHLMAYLWSLWNFTHISAWRMRFKPRFECHCGSTFSHAHKHKVYQFTLPSLRHTVLPMVWNITTQGSTTVTYQGSDGTCQMQLVVTCVDESHYTELSINAKKFVVFNDGVHAPYLSMSFFGDLVGVIQVELRFQWTNSPVRLMVVNRLYLAAKIAQVHGRAPPALKPVMLQAYALYPYGLHTNILPANTEGLLVEPLPPPLLLLPPPPLLHVQVPELYAGSNAAIVAS
jgi:hypothetical protein